MAPSDEFATAQMLCDELARALKDCVERAFQVAIESFLQRKLAIQKIKRLALCDGRAPYTPWRIVPGICDRQHREALRRKRARLPWPTVGRQIEHILGIRAAMEKDERAIRVDLALGAIQRAMNVPRIAVAGEARRHLALGEPDFLECGTNAHPPVPVERHKDVLALQASQHRPHASGNFAHV